MARHGITHVAGTPLPAWTPQASLDVMDVNAIQTALLSLSAPGVFFGDVAEARSLARACNDYSARVVSDHPGRFGMFAVLPTPYADMPAPRRFTPSTLSRLMVLCCSAAPKAYSSVIRGLTS